MEGDECGAEAATDERKHKNDAENPEVLSHSEIVIHSPQETLESVQ